MLTVLSSPLHHVMKINVQMDIMTVTPTQHVPTNVMDLLVHVSKDMTAMVKLAKETVMKINVKPIDVTPPG